MTTQDWKFRLGCAGSPNDYTTDGRYIPGRGRENGGGGVVYRLVDLIVVCIHVSDPMCIRSGTTRVRIGCIKI